MTKSEFLWQLSRALKNVSERDREDALAYYREMIEDRMESGMSEEEAVAALGAPADAAKDIMCRLPLPTLIKNKCKEKSTWHMWEVVLLILGSPVWLSLLVCILACVAVVYICLWTVVLALWACAVSLCVGGVVLVVAGVVSFYGAAGTALLNIGVGLIAVGGGLLLFFISPIVTRIMIRLSKLFLRGMKYLIIGKNKKKGPCTDREMEK